ncbi:MAG: hypothetical protein J3K34DRAFT_485301 [Monoraphidium minutum]|nr:MAG: hypothetical protein J3K34DRAFT_485301 [Monoraphidium minutum]
MKTLARSLVLLALAAACAACTPCSSCRDPDCWRGCSVYCPAAPAGPPTPDSVTVARGSKCLDAGAGAGPRTAAGACEYAARQCEPAPAGGQRLGAAYGADALGAMTLSQCSKVAMGACQQAAGDTAPDACQDAGANGYGSCDAERFRALFHAAAARTCESWARSITDVDPTTGAWAPAQGGAPGGGRRMLLGRA